MATTLCIEDRKQKKMSLCGTVIREEAKHFYTHFKRFGNEHKGGELGYHILYRLFLSL